MDKSEKISESICIHQHLIQLKTAESVIHRMCCCWRVLVDIEAPGLGDLGVWIESSGV